MEILAAVGTTPMQLSEDSPPLRSMTAHEELDEPLGESSLLSASPSRLRLLNPPAPTVRKPALAELATHIRT